jgi:hypothetical protein
MQYFIYLHDVLIKFTILCLLFPKFIFVLHNFYENLTIINQNLIILKFGFVYTYIRLFFLNF